MFGRRSSRESANNSAQIPTGIVDLLEVVDAEYLLLAPGEIVLRASDASSTLGMVRDGKLISNEILNIVRACRRSQISQENTIELPEDLQLNAEKYIKAMIGHPNVKYEDGIIYQYGMGGLKGTGSYDRYVAFKNQPDANFLIIYWPLGMIQVAKNPFKENLKYEELDLNDRAKKVMEQFQPMLEDKIITLSTIKWVNEEKAKEGSVGFMYNDFYCS
jgi:hypothetical protein